MISYKRHNLGEQVLNIIVDNKILVELKAVESLNKLHEVQLISYLKVAKRQIGLLVNFSKPSLEWKRIKLKDELLKSV